MEPNLLNEIIGWLNDFYYSDFMLWIKFIVGVYTVIVFIDLILLLILQIKKSWRVTLKGADIDVPGSKKIKKEFEKIEAFLNDKNEAFWKIAVLEADKLVDQVLYGFGYSGKDMGEKLSRVNPDQIEYYNELKEAHKIRNQIIKEKKFALSQDEARRIVNIYKKYLELVNLLD